MKKSRASLIIVYVVGISFVLVVSLFGIEIARYLASGISTSISCDRTSISSTSSTSAGKGLHAGGGRESAEGFVRRRFNQSELLELYRKVPTPNGLFKGDPGYFTKRDDLQASVDRAKRMHTGVHKIVEYYGDLFPGRLFALLDLIDWNDELGFLNCTKALVLNKDVENQLVNAKDGLQLYVFQGSKPPYGDLHYKVMESYPGGYDLVLFGQTFEHLYDPVLCFKNLYDAMAPGGYLFTTGPSLNHLHMHPTFYSMPTPFGLPVWFAQAGFDVIKVGVFGNKEYLRVIITETITWWPKARRYIGTTEEVPKGIQNDPKYPGQVWILVQKPFDAPA